MIQKLCLLAISCLFVSLVAHRVWRYASITSRMPQAATEAVARQLHLVPAGAYSRADIDANGSATPAQKYRGYRAQHDASPQPGDRLCPVTRTKASPRCTWIVAGREYQFCCPPCIDEFVRLAKERPGELKQPDDYVKR